MSTTVRPADATAAMLRFAYAQSYGKQVDEDRGGRTAPPWSAPGERVRLPGGLGTGCGDPAAHERPDGRATWRTALRHLVLSGQVLRREPGNPYNDHRSYPSSASQFSTHLWLEWGHPPTVWHYHPLEHAIERVSAAAAPGPGTDAPGYRILVAADYAEIDPGYRTLRYALSLLEAGHCLYNVAALARSLGFPHRVHLWFDDRAVLDHLGVEPDGHWIPAGVVEVGEPASPLPVGRGGAEPPPAADDVGAADRLGWHGPPGPVAPTMGVPRAVPLADLTRLLAQRTSGRGMLGVTGRAERLPRRVLDDAVSALVAAASSAGVPDGAHRYFVAVQGVEDCPAGLYAIGPAGRLALVRPGAEVFVELQRAYSYPPAVMTITSFHLVFLMAVDYPRILRDTGPRGFRLTQLQLGWAAQAVGLSLTASDCFCRPVRAYSERRLDQLLGLAAGEVVAYELLCSRNHMRDLTLDLRVWEEEP